MPAITRSVDPQSYTGDFGITCLWNDQNMVGSFTGFYDHVSNIGGGVIDSPDNGEMLSAWLSASCTSFISWVYCVYSKGVNGAVNLASVTGLPFEAHVDFTMVDGHGNVIGQVHQVGRAREESSGHLMGDVVSEGFYKGPKNIVWSPGYPILLRQVGYGTIEGVYGQTILTEEGDAFYVLSRRKYIYDNDNTLPFDEIWSYRLLNLDIRVENGRRLFDYRASAYYVPADGPRGSVEEANRSYSDVLESLAKAAV